MKHWDSPWLAGKYVEDVEAFLFSLSLKKEYRAKKATHAIYVSRYYGPVFGKKDIEFKSNVTDLNAEDACYCHTGHPESVYLVPKDD